MKQTKGTKQQQTHRLQERMSSYQREGCGRSGGEGGRRGLRGIMFSTHGVGYHGENSVAQRRHTVDLWHLAALMDSDCIGLWVGT